MEVGPRLVNLLQSRAGVINSQWGRICNRILSPARYANGPWHDSSFRENHKLA